MTTRECARSKMLFVVAASTALFFLRSWILLVFLSAFLFSFVLKRHGNIRRRVKPLFFVFCFVLLFHLVFETGTSIQTRVFGGVFAGTRITILSLLVFWFTETTSPSAIIQGLAFLPPSIRLMLTISLALIPVLLDEIGLIQRVQETRGLAVKKGNAFTTLPAILVPLLHRTLARAEKLAIVLQTRGYTA